jgi:hypothetical protein
VTRAVHLTFSSQPWIAQDGVLHKLFATQNDRVSGFLVVELDSYFPDLSTYIPARWYCMLTTLVEVHNKVRLY